MGKKLALFVNSTLAQICEYLTIYRFGGSSLRMLSILESISYRSAGAVNS
jgi:hypothetical protein